MSPPVAMLPPRRFGRFNWLGLWSHYRRGVRRFLDYAWESLGGPCVFTLMFLAVFVVAFGPDSEVLPGLSYARFIAPGLVIFALCDTAFESAAFSVLDDKLNRTIEDLLTAPLSPLEVVSGYVLSAASNAFMTGVAVGTLIAIFAQLALPDILPLLAFAFLGALLFALLGTLVGVWAEKWDHFSFAYSFLILPLGMLSGTFFPTTSLPELGRTLITLNPVFYVIDGFRSAFLDYSETAVPIGAGSLALLVLALFLLAWYLIARGYKIKA